jgi:hypothetical protein
LILSVSMLGAAACGGESDDGGDDAADTGGSTGAPADDDGTTGGGADDDADTIDPSNLTDPTDPMTDDGGSSDGPDADSGDTGMPAELDCAGYCATYMTACTDYNAYANEQDCMDHCGQWPLGAEADTAGDTLGCRLYHATVAGTAEPDVHCPHAGPAGGGVCAEADAPSCADYCETYFDNCTEDLNAYTDMDDCMTQCAPWYPGIEGDAAGNSVGCRTYHAGAPAVGDPELHCPHAGPGGDGVCVFVP